MGTGTRGAVRKALLRLGLAALLGGALAGARVSAAPEEATSQPLVKVSEGGARPFSESVRQMELRDRAIAVGIAAGRFTAPDPLPVVRRPKRQKLDRQPGDSVGLFQAPAGRAPFTTSAAFTGVGLQDQQSIFGVGFSPPDTMGAIGPNHFLQVLNGSVAIYDRSGTRRSILTLNTFLRIVSGNISYPRGSVIDPRVQYDRRSGHWFVCGAELGGTDVAHNNHFILAVSKTSDPTQGFNKYLIEVALPDKAGVSFFNDYPAMAVDDNGVYIGYDVISSDGKQYSAFTATPKAPLIADSPSRGAVFISSDPIKDLISPHPAVNVDGVAANAPVWILSPNTHQYGGLAYRTFRWNNGTPTLSSAADLVVTPQYGLPPHAPSSGTEGLADSGDDRIIMGLVRGGRLWTCHGVGVNSTGGIVVRGNSTDADRVACEWMELDVTAAKPTLVQSGRVFDPAPTDPRFYFYPSLCVSGQGHVVMAFSGSKHAEFIGAYTCSRLASDPLGTMGAVELLKPGAAPYGLKVGRDQRVRWGDYSYTTLDPNDDMSLWTVQEFVAAQDRWGTWISRQAAPAPTLDPRAANGVPGQNNVAIPLTGTGFFDPGQPFVSRLSIGITGEGIQNPRVAFQSSTSATLTVDLAADAPTGQRDLILTNPDGQSASLPNAFTVGDLFQLGLDTTTILESAGPLSVQVTRAGSAAAAATVDYATSPGTAGAGDFASTSGTLTFGPGERSKTIEIPITSDSDRESDETFTLTLGNPTGAFLGLPVRLTVTIVDDDTPPNPPASLTAILVSPTRIDLSWQDRTSDETGFTILRKKGTNAPATVGHVDAGVTTYSDTAGLIANTLYTYTVRAETPRGPSAPSNEVKVTTPRGQISVPATLDFGKYPVGRTSQKTLTVQNVSPKEKLWISVVVPAAPFGLAKGVVTALVNAKAKLALKVTFTPTAKKAFAGTLVVTSSDPRKKSVTVKLKGSGK